MPQQSPHSDRPGVCQLRTLQRRLAHVGRRFAPRLYKTAAFARTDATTFTKAFFLKFETLLTGVRRLSKPTSKRRHIFPLPATAASNARASQKIHHNAYAPFTALPSPRGFSRRLHKHIDTRRAHRAHRMPSIARCSPDKPPEAIGCSIRCWRARREQACCPP
jgi:hypothetical protein